MNINKSKASGLMNVLTIILILVMVYICSGCSGNRYHEREAIRNEQLFVKNCLMNRICDKLVTGQN
jgi:hypothetical protein